jgi:hypothetical protein
LFIPWVIVSMVSCGDDDASRGNSSLIHLRSLAVLPAESSGSKEEEWMAE